MSSELLRSDAASVYSTGIDPTKRLWCDTQWTSLSRQAQALGLPKLPYFDPKTMLLSKEINKKLWRELGRLYNLLGPERAPFATPVMLEGGVVEWYSYVDGAKGAKADIFEED